MPDVQLRGSVGVNGENNPEDVKTIQAALNTILDLIPPTQTLDVDGSLGRQPETSNTVVAIKALQKNLVKMVNPDGRIDPNGKSHKVLINAVASKSEVVKSDKFPEIRGERDLNDAAFQAAADTIGCEVEAIKAVAHVEAAGDGFFDSGFPKILFEAHIFSRETHHAFDESNPDISSKKWNRALYLRGEQEYNRLKSAMLINRAAAISSASWGKFQIMGFNHQACGYTHLEDFLNDMFYSESKQLHAFVAFLKSNHLDAHLRNKDWAKFAKGYNGPAYAKNKYDEKLKTAYESFK